MRKDNDIDRLPALGCAISVIHQRLISQLGDALTEAGLDITAAEYLVIRALYASDGIQQCEIAGMVGKDKAAVSRTVASLRQKGYVKTTPISHKCRTVHLTHSGVDIKNQIADIARRRHQAFAEMLTPNEFKTFSRLIDKISKQL